VAWLNRSRERNETENVCRGADGVDDFTDAQPVEFAAGTRYLPSVVYQSAGQYSREAEPGREVTAQPRQIHCLVRRARVQLHAVLVFWSHFPNKPA
jgi:hypothetical protein